MRSEIRNLLDGIYTEAEKAVQNPRRTMQDVGDSQIKVLLQKEAVAVTTAAKASAGAIAGTRIGTAAIKASAGAIAGTKIGTAAGAVAGSGLGFSALSGAGAATGFATAGATFGSAVPIVGTVIGAAVGAGLGYIFGRKKRNQAERQARQELEEIRVALEKQNRYIRQLETELEELRKKFWLSKKNEARYQYILSIVTAHYDAKETFLPT